MNKVKVFFLALAIVAGIGCAKKVQAPVPGSIDSNDAYAYRIASDAQAAILSVKTWEMCSDHGFPATVAFDNFTGICDPASGVFPAKGRPLLFKAEKSYNVLQDAGKAYHAGAGGDAAALTAAIVQMSQDISAMFAGVGK